jgi:hypothetical protein
MTDGWRRLAAMLLVVLALPFTAAADDPDAGTDRDQRVAPVMLDGRTLFRVRGV